MSTLCSGELTISNLAEAVDMAAMPDNSNKTANNVKYSICKGMNHETWCQPTKFAITAILNFVSTSNFISIHSPSIYKLSMIRLMHKVHFDVDF